MTSLLPSFEARGQLGLPGTAATAALIWLVAALGVLAVFQDTTASLVGVWYTSVIYGHGFLIPPICAFLAWQRWGAARRVGVRPLHPLGWLALLGAGTIWLVGALTLTELLQHAGLVGMLQALVVLILGPRMAWALSFPLVYAVLAVPFGESVVPFLQSLTATHTTDLLRATGVPVYMADWRLVTPDGVFLVAEVCAGLQYILACLAIGGLIAGMWFQTWWTRAVVLGIALGLPIVANVLRAYGIIMLADLVSFEAASGVAHVVYGFIFLSLLTLGAIAIAHRLRGSAPQGEGLSEAHTGAVAGRRAWARPAAAAGVGLILALAFKSAVVLTAPAAASTAGQALRPPDLPPPDLGESWTRTAAPDWTPKLRGSPAAGNWTYVQADADGVAEGGGVPVTLSLAYHPRQDGRAEIAGGRLFFVPHDETSLRFRGKVEAAPVPGVAAPRFARFVPADGEAPRLVWYWYWVGGHLTDSPAVAKLQGLRVRLTGGPPGAAVIAVSAPLWDAASDDAPAATRAALTAFLSAAAPADLIAAALGRDSPVSLEQPVSPE